MNRQNNIISDYRLMGKAWRDITYDMSISADMARYLARNPYAWPGGYPLFAVTDDGAALCHTCCKTEYRNIRESTPGDGWTIAGIDINYEDSECYCAHCNERIEAAYE